MAINVKEKAKKLLIAIRNYGGWYRPDAWVVSSVDEVERDSRDQVHITVYEITLPVSLTKKLEERPNRRFELGSVAGIPLEISNITKVVATGLNISVAGSHHLGNKQKWWYDKELPPIPYKKIARI